MLIFAFCLAFLALILQSLLIPHIAILAFAPFIALATLRLPLSKVLWLSALAGSLVDLLSDDPMGLHALNYVCVSALLFQIRQHFSHDQPFHLSLFSSLASLFSTLLQLFLLFLFDRRVPFGGRWIFADLIGMPVIDALYAFVWFAAPLTLAEKLHRMWVIFWLKKKDPSLLSR